VLITVVLAAIIARADSLQLKNGLINGRFMGGSSNFLWSIGTSQGLIPKLNGGHYFGGVGSLDFYEFVRVGLLFQEDFDSI